MSNLASSHIAIHGCDPVSIFQGRAQNGKNIYSCVCENQTWLFASQGNLDLFKQNPGAYMPQFAGHCALAVSLGQLAPGKPTAWNIIDNKLYFSGNSLAGLLFRYIPGRKTAAHKKWHVLTNTSSLRG